MNIFTNLYSLLFVVLLCSASSCMMLELEQGVQWLSWEAAEQKANSKDKKVIVWVYDKTCPTCKEAEQRIFGDASNADFINQHFYPIKLEGRHPDPIISKGKEYKQIGSFNGYDYHQLAVAITQSKEDIYFPQIVFMNENMEVITPITGDVAADELRLLLAFVEGDYFKSMNIEEFKNRK